MENGLGEDENRDRDRDRDRDRAQARDQDEDQDQDQDQDEGDLDDQTDASQLERFMRDRRRAKSLPAYPVSLLAGGPGSLVRKRVQFADALGQNLASVKHFSSLEEPRIPSKVLSRHRSFPPAAPPPAPAPPPPQTRDLLPDLCHSFRSCLDTDRLVACFPEPRDPDARVRMLRVCLERISITRFDVRGQIRVLRGGRADGEVGVRYTFNDWLSHVDAQAVPADAQAVPAAAGQPGSVGERFSFTVYTPPVMEPSGAVHFAVYLRSGEGEFWDNNDGQNYVLRYCCLPGTGPTLLSAAFQST